MRQCHTLITSSSRYNVIPVFCMVIDHTEGIRLLKTKSRLALMERRKSRVKSEYAPGYRSSP
jgi:hypothetical protein